MKTTLSITQKIAQCFSPAAFIHDTEENYLAIEKLIREEQIGGLTFFHSRISAAANFEKRAETLAATGTFEKMIALINRYQSISKIPLLISIDGEYGLAMRIEETPQYPFAITLGALKDDASTWVEEVGYRMGLDMKKAGVHLNLAPCADVNTNPDNPVIGYRSFGNNTAQVSDLALAAYRGMRKANIGACLKHFPGHGDTHTDSHLGLPVIQKTKQELLEEELFPFQQGIDQGVEMIMVGHLAVPALTKGKETSSSLSREIVTDLLKNEMGFKGVVISDALNMKAVSKLYETPGQLEWEAFHAGNDILCFSDHVKEGIEQISKHASNTAIEEVFEKIWALKEKLGVLEFKPLENPSFDWENHALFQMQLAEQYVAKIAGEIDTQEINKIAGNQKLSHQTFFGNEDAVFEQKLNTHFQTDLSKVKVESAEKIIISVFVPSHKPLNQFGMDDQILNQIKELAQAKKCILVHFGNPLALSFLGNLSAFEAVICAYQNFDEAQFIAAKYFM